MSCSSEERCLCKKHIFKIKKHTKRSRSKSKSEISQVMQGALVQQRRGEEDEEDDEEEEGMVGGVSRFTDEQWRWTCWHSSQGCHVLARSAALLWTDAFTCASWFLTCCFQSSGAESRATAGQG